MRTISRRGFLETAGALAAVSALRPPLAAAAGSPKKSVLITMLPKELPFVDRFKLALDAGFVGIEMQTVGDPAEAEKIRDASEKSGLRIHSVMNSEHWRSPIPTW
jgi:L-ribulose-5-phosphate 3-epimerase